MKKAFTLMELLVIIAIIAVMTTVSVLSISGGQKAARVKGATRDVFAAIRQARSQAIVAQKPVVVTYSNDTTEDGEAVAKVEAVSASDEYLFTDPVDPSQIQTLTGPARRSSKDVATKNEGSLLKDVLFAPIGEDVVRGIRLKAVKGDAVASDGTVPRRRASMFSNVDFLIRQYQRMRGVSASESAAKSETDADEKKDAKSDAGADEVAAPLSVVWSTNGRVEPHQVWVYAEGQKPEDGQLIRVDRFGAVKVLSGDGREEDER